MSKFMQIKEYVTYWKTKFKVSRIIYNILTVFNFYD